MPRNFITVDGKKFIWDGVCYPGEEHFSEKMEKYKTDGFEVERFEEDGKTYLYTRRAVKEVIVEKT